MMLHILLVAEILATVTCIHCIYGKKVKIDIQMVGLIIGILIILEIANYFRVLAFSFGIYVILFLYCKYRFRSRGTDVAISLMLCMIMVTSMQFVCGSLIKLIVANEYVRSAASNILIWIILYSHIMLYGLHSLQKSLIRKSKLIVIVSGFVCLIVFCILLQGKIFYELHIQYFILVVPTIFMLLYSIIKWYSVQVEMDNIREEIQMIKESEKYYDSLLTKIRLHQHEFKNHIAAIFAAHYTHKTYEKLVQAQEEYCNKLLEENKYNNLLILENKILVGFLYSKFQEAEEDGIKIRCKVTVKLDNIQIPIYYVVEMFGILLDNAMEALFKSTEKIISFEIIESREGYEILIGNPYRYVSYDEISEWFNIEKSEKGSGRGLGLYHLKCLCEEWNCDIGCKNIEIDKNNWIMFKLKLSKAGNR